MLIGELLELTKKKPLNEIAKEHLEIGERYARMALKSAGCYNISGKRGWYYEGDPSVLDRPIYDFAPNKGNKPKSKKTSKPALDPEVEKEKLKEFAVELASNHKKRDIFDTLLNPKPNTKVKPQRGFYFDPEVIDALDKYVPNKNKSEFVNEAVKRILKEKGLLK